MYRVLQISDTHLSRVKRHFAANWLPLRDWINAQRADLIIHTGDVTVDGADVEDDMLYCRELLRELDAPLLAVPGNHDVGEPRHPRQPVNAERLARWRSYFGPDYWFRDVENWRLIGLDSMLFGSGEPEEAEQFTWLERVMSQAKDRAIAWFTHRPLFLQDPSEGDQGYWAPPPDVRSALMALLRQYRVSLVASGHLHKFYDTSLDGIRFIWASSSAFMVSPALQPPIAGAATLGALVYKFAESTVESRFETIEGLRPFRIEDVINEVYPSPTA